MCIVVAVKHLPYYCLFFLQDTNAPEICITLCHKKIKAVCYKVGKNGIHAFVTYSKLIILESYWLLLEMTKHTWLRLWYKKIAIWHLLIQFSLGLTTRTVCQLGTSQFSFVMLATRNYILRTAIRNSFRGSQCQTFWWGSGARTAPRYTDLTSNLFFCFCLSQWITILWAKSKEERTTDIPNLYLLFCKIS